MAVTVDLFNAIKATYKSDNTQNELIHKLSSIHDILNKSNWRIKKKHPVKILKNTDDSKNKLISYLNKITGKTYDTLSEKIINTCSTTELSEYLIESIFEIAIKQPIYCSYYVKLAKTVIKKYPVINNFIETKCKEFLNININNNSKDSFKLNYTDFCENNKLKLMKEGYSKYIGELFKESIINYSVTIDTLFILIQNLNLVLTSNSIDKTSIEDNIICITILYKTIYNSINTEDKTKILTSIDTFLENTFIIKRLKFKLMDLKEYT